MNDDYFQPIRQEDSHMLRISLLNLLPVGASIGSEDESRIFILLLSKVITIDTKINCEQDNRNCYGVGLSKDRTIIFFFCDSLFCAA